MKNTQKLQRKKTEPDLYKLQAYTWFLLFTLRMF